MEVFAGAQQLFSKCQVAAVIWEKSEFHEGDDQSRRNSTILGFLNARGFKHYRFENESKGSALIPLTGAEGVCNVVSLISDNGTE